MQRPTCWFVPRVFRTSSRSAGQTTQTSPSQLFPAMATSRSEDVLGHKWDRCVADTLVKIGGGLTLGVIFSAIVFKRRSWPVIFGTGAGMGMGYANCQHEFNEPFLVRADKIVVKPKSPRDPEPAAVKTE